MCMSQTCTVCMNVLTALVLCCQHTALVHKDHATSSPSQTPQQDIAPDVAADHLIPMTVCIIVKNTHTHTHTHKHCYIVS